MKQRYVSREGEEMEKLGKFK